MHLFKKLNRTIYILLIICVVLLFFNSTAISHTITSRLTSAASNRQVTFTSNFNHSAIPGDAYGWIDYGDGTGTKPLPASGSPFSVSGSGLSTQTFVSTYTYSKAGTYTVRTWTTLGGSPVPPILPNPAVMTQQIDGLTINRIQLYFENNRPEITIKRNQKPPKLSAKVAFSGSGYLKGYWEIDGKRQNYVFKNLSKGPSVILNYPAVPPIPTFNYGTHSIRFVITSPAMNINFPYGIYFVTSDTKKEPIVISLLEPVKGEDIAYKPLTFKWKPVTKASIYLISVFSKTKEERIFSAYTRQGEYKLKTNILKTRMQSGDKYIWNVVGFNEQNEVTAESIASAFSFNRETAFLPGQILFITKPTLQGEKSIQEVKAKYGLEILETYPIKTLELQVTKFHTDKDIFSIIRDLEQRQGVVAAQPNYIFKTMSEPMNELQSIRKIIKIGSDIPFKGKGVTIAIIDTGVDLKHKDLVGAISFKANCLFDSKYQPEIHGTAVAGLIGARQNNFGIDGYAPESKIFALRACKQISETQPRGECYSSSIAKALDLAIQQRVQIINMSLGTNVKDRVISKLIDEGSKQGILFVASAGDNSEIFELSFPASHPKVISVAGVTEKGEFFPNAQVAKRSNFYLSCENLFSTIPHDKHNFLSGTSLSTAVVSGLLALAHEKNRDMIVNRLRYFDGDINKWVNTYLMSSKIATQKKQ